MIPPPVPAPDGPFALRPITHDRDDAARVSSWMNTPHVASTWKQDWDVERWAGEIARQLAGDWSRPAFVLRGDEPVAYTELYRVRGAAWAPHYRGEPDDLGVHLAIGPATEVDRGLGRRILGWLAAGLFDGDPDCRRVVAEPDAGNARMHAALVHAGFRRAGTMTLPHKTAALMVRFRTPADDPEGDLTATG